MTFNFVKLPELDFDLNAVTTESGRTYETPTGEKYPSITTVLSSYNKKALFEWRRKVGEEEANRIKIEASTIGTYMHEYLEGYITGNGYENQTDHGQKAKLMAQKIQEQGLCNVDEVWGCEVGLFYPYLYAGTTDVVGVHNGDDSIIDFKQANKPKQREWIQDYLMQLSAYALAHDVLYGTKIKKGVVMMCTRDLLYQEFVLEGESFLRAQQAWLRLVGEYHIKNSNNG